MLMTRNVLPQIALHAAKATQGPASEVGRASAGDWLTDHVYHLSRNTGLGCARGAHASALVPAPTGTRSLEAGVAPVEGVVTTHLGHANIGTHVEGFRNVREQRRIEVPFRRVGSRVHCSVTSVPEMHE
jgi:hypothetical protein